jgi:hypothetical protein
MDRQRLASAITTGRHTRPSFPASAQVARWEALAERVGVGCGGAAPKNPTAV